MNLLPSTNLTPLNARRLETVRGLVVRGGREAQERSRRAKGQLDDLFRWLGGEPCNRGTYEKMAALLRRDGESYPSRALVWQARHPDRASNPPSREFAERVAVLHGRVRDFLGSPIAMMEFADESVSVVVSYDPAESGCVAGGKLSEPGAVVRLRSGEGAVTWVPEGLVSACDECGNPFLRRSWNAMRCSDPCRLAARRRRRRQGRGDLSGGTRAGRNRRRALAVEFVRDAERVVTTSEVAGGLGTAYDVTSRDLCELRRSGDLYAERVPTPGGKGGTTWVYASVPLDELPDDARKARGSQPRIRAVRKRKWEIDEEDDDAVFFGTVYRNEGGMSIDEAIATVAERWPRRVRT